MDEKKGLSIMGEERKRARVFYTRSRSQYARTGLFPR